MAKWADYLISAVHYTITDKKISISHVHVHEYKNDSVGPALTLTRGELINRLYNHNTFKTIYKNDGKWEPGEDVRKVKINIYYYLRQIVTIKKKITWGIYLNFRIYISF